MKWENWKITFINLKLSNLKFVIVLCKSNTQSVNILKGISHTCLLIYMSTANIMYHNTITEIASNAEYTKSISEFVNFRQHVLNLDAVHLQSKTEKICSSEFDTTNNTTTLIHKLEHVKTEYYYLQDFVFHIKTKEFSESLSQKIPKLLKSVELLIGNQTFEQFNSETLSFSHKKQNKGIYLVINSDGTTSIYISLPFSLTSGNNILLSSFMRDYDILLKIVLSDDILPCMEFEISFTKIIVDLVTNNKYPLCKFSQYDQDIVFSQLFEQVYYNKTQLNRTNKKHNEIKFNLFQKKNTTGFNFYFMSTDENGKPDKIIKDNIFQNVQIQIGNKINNLSMLEFINGSSLSVKDGIYNFPIELYKNIKSNEPSLQLIFDFKILNEFKDKKIYVCLVQTLNEILMYREKNGVCKISIDTQT